MGMMIVKNENNELIPNWIVMGLAYLHRLQEVK